MSNTLNKLTIILFLIGVVFAGCSDPCAGKECGTSEGVNCGTCNSGDFCNSSNSCEEVTFPDMILVPSGTIASDNGSIAVDHDFYIGKYEVSFEEYEQFATVDDSGWGKGTRPVINVSWYDAIKYVNWLSNVAGLEKVYAEICYTDHASCTMDTNKKGYRLPTEKEWEYAARGGKDGNVTTYSGSNTIRDVAWYDDNSGSKTHEVGTKNANELGIYDMSGNVWEWNFDRWDATSSARVLRGGSWLSYAYYCEVGYRFSNSPSFRYSNIGFRVSRTK